MQITFAEPFLPKSGPKSGVPAGALVVAVLAGRRLSPTAKALDEKSRGQIRRAMAASRFTGARGQWLELPAPAGIACDRLLLCGLGAAAEIDLLALEAMGGEAVQRLQMSGIAHLAIACDAMAEAKPELAESAARIAFGARLGAYRFDKYRTTRKAEQKPSLEQVAIQVSGAPAAKRAYLPLSKVADGVLFTRDLVSEPANILYPATLAKECRKLEKLGVKVEILGEAQMRRLGFGALLGVGQGSVRESQLAVLQWRGGPKNQPPLAFVGKGVCFDTGGISIKPAAGMEEMKWDMGGAGTVIGLMMALAGRKARVNAVGVAGLVENMPSGTAQRPGDVVTSLSGQTIEVLNTDAEGRLVLADALWYTQERFKPKLMVDLATLTGAIIVALGHEHAGLFANDDELAARLAEAGAREGEKVWRLPLGEAYDQQLSSPIADVQNIGQGRTAGSIVAAQFLQRFVNKVPWAHLDIAGTAWSKKSGPTVPKGATGFGVRLLDRLVAAHYEGR